MYKLIAFDIDGTILPEGTRDFSEDIKKMFKKLKEKGFITAFCTGREFVTIGELIHTKNIDYFIGANGAFIVDLKTSKTIYENAIKFEDYKKLEDFCEIKNYNLSVMTENAAYFKDKSSYEGNWFWGQFYNLLRPLNSPELKKDLIHQITVRTNEPKEILEVKKFVKKTERIEVNTLFSSGLFVAAEGVNKGSGLKILGKKINVKLSEMIAFGDGPNDYEMIEEVGHGVAMGQAGSKLKDMAADITDTCKNNGVIKKLEKMGII